VAAFASSLGMAEKTFSAGYFWDGSLRLQR